MLIWSVLMWNRKCCFQTAASFRKYWPLLMMAHPFFIFCSALQDGSTGLVSDQLSVYSVTEGTDVRVECSFPSYRKSSFFCKEKCKQEDVLIETTDATDYQRGRYRIDHKQEGFFVTITQLTKSDSGEYRCGSTASSSRNSYKLIEIIVVDGEFLLKTECSSLSK